MRLCNFWCVFIQRIPAFGGDFFYQTQHALSISPIRYYLQSVLFCNVLVFVTACQQSESKASFAQKNAPATSRDYQQPEAAPVPFEPSGKVNDSEADIDLFSSSAARMLDHDFGKRWIRRADVEF